MPVAGRPCLNRSHCRHRLAEELQLIAERVYIMTDAVVNESFCPQQDSACGPRRASCGLVSAAGCLSLAADSKRKLRRSSLTKSGLLSSALETPGSFRLPFGVQVSAAAAGQLLRCASLASLSVSVDERAETRPFC